MPLYRKADDRLEPVQMTSFAAERLQERGDLQRMLRADLSPLGAKLLLLAEEYSDWQDSSRRIDLLCLRSDGTLVVVEIKRTNDGGHMELQALRYAAMVAGMTLPQAINTYARTHRLDNAQASRAVLEFLNPAFDESVHWTRNVAVILVSADFSTEVTTSVLWLNERNLDITCIRLRPYRLGADILVDATQIIPLPEAKDYAVKLRQQEDERIQVLGVRQEALHKFFTQLIARASPETTLLRDRKASTEGNIAVGVGRSGVNLWTTVKKESSRVECYISLEEGQEASARAFDHLASQKGVIEAAFGGPLDWQPLPSRGGCRICVDVAGGWKSPESEWPGLQDTLIKALMRLDAALKQPLQKLPR